MFEMLILLICRFLFIFLIALFIVVPLFINLFKICFKQFKEEKKNINEFLKEEKRKVER